MASRIRFGEFELDLGSGELERDGVRTRLQEHPFKLLRALASRPGEMLTRAELITLLWPAGVVVDFDTGLNTAVRKLRAALGDEAGTARYVETLPRRGYRLIPCVQVLAPSTDVPAIHQPAVARPRLRVWAVLAGLVTVVTLGLLLLDRPSAGARNEPLEPVQSAPPERSVAVLPFQNLTDPEDGAFLASGLSESVLHQLTLLPAATVISRSSSFSPQARGGDPQSLSRLLNVRYLLTGSVQRQDDQLRVIATLLDSSSGEQVWSARFDRSLSDVFAVQDEIATQVAKALRISLDATATARLSARGTASIDAYMEYLQGRGLAATYRAPDLDLAASHYRNAIVLDPRFSAAYSGLASTLLRTLDFRVDDDLPERRRRIRNESRKLAERALALDASNADAHLALASLAEDRPTAESHDRKALELNPNSAGAHYGLALSAWRAALTDLPGRAEESFSHIERAIELAPLEPEYLVNKAKAIRSMRGAVRIAEVGPLLERALELDPGYFPALTFQAEQRWCCEKQTAEGIRLAERVLTIDPTSSEAALLLMHMYLSLDDVAAATQLQKQYAHNSDARGAILARRRSWGEAARIVYDERTRDSQASAPSHVPLLLAVRMHAYDTGDFQSACRLTEAIADLRGLKESGDLVPILGTDFRLPVLHGEMLLGCGEPERGRQVLEAALRVMHRTDSEFQRGGGQLWFPYPRARALMLLGRSGEALAEIERLRASGAYNNTWELEFDPVFKDLRDEPRFQAVLAQYRDYVAGQRREVEALRARGIIPQRG